MSTTIDIIMGQFKEIPGLLMAIVGIFGGAGFWNWKTRKTELLAGSQESYHSELAKQVKENMDKIDELHDARYGMMEQIAKLQGELHGARQEIQSLKDVIEGLGRGDNNGQ